MENAPLGAPPVFLQDGQGIAVGFPVVDEEGQVQVFGQLDLPAEPGLLGFLVAVEVVVVQADLADGLHLR